MTGATKIPDNNDLSIVYLGKWAVANSYGSRERSLVVPYHWDDRKQLFQDYQFLSGIIDQATIMLATSLNSIHGTNFSSKYWKIIIGPWLIAFVPAVLDRYKSIQTAIATTPKGSVFLSSCDFLIDESSNDMQDFLKDLVDPLWNEGIYRRFLIEMNASIEVSEHEDLFGASETFTSPNSGKNKQFLKRLLQVTLRRNKHAFSTTYISPGVLRRLQISLKQFPLTLPQLPLPKFESNISLRKRTKWPIKFDRSAVPSDYQMFLSILEEIIPAYIPRSYLEGFSFTQQLPNTHHWPKSVKTVITSTGIYNDEAFKVWAAEQTEKGAKLVLAQHGGCYGTSLFHSREQHELSISDRYLTWGWEKEGFGNIAPIGNFTNKKLPKSDIHGKALIGLTQGNDYTSFLESTPLSAGQWDKYQEQQLHFVGLFSSEFLSNLKIRLYPSKTNKNLRTIWLDSYPNISIDEPGVTFNKSLRSARMYVGTDNNTTWLNALNSNFPTMVVIDPKYWEIRREAAPYFSALESAGIFHRSAESAAKHLQAIWSDLEEWWGSPLVQESRLKFISQYSAQSSSFYKRIKHVILE